MKRRFEDEREDAEQDTTRSASAASAPPISMQQQVLAMQRSAGNAAVQEWLGGLAPVGKEPEEAEEPVGGAGVFERIGEMVGDANRIADAAAGNAIGGIAGALTGVQITTSTNSGPTWNDHGHFDWRVGFNTTGANGWIVQEIVNTYRAEDATGAAVPGRKPTPRYWEAWAVDGSNKVTPAIGPDNDYWIRPRKGKNTKGHWSMTGRVFFTTVDPATKGLSPGGVPDAGILLSSTSSPGGLGIALLHRYAQGTWDSTGATPVHTGQAGP